MNFLGIDLGTTKVAAALVDTEGAGVVWTAGREHRATVGGGHPWEHLQDPELILAVARELLADAAEVRSAIDGICISGQMHGVLYLDGHGAPLSPLFTWLDARGAQRHPDGLSYAELLSRSTGYHLSPGFGTVTHFYNLTNGLVPKGAATLSTILDFVTMRLCGGERPVSDATAAASLGVFDLAASRFDRAALARGGIDGVAYPEVAGAGAPVGRTPGGFTLFAPVADNQASFVGAVKEPERSILVNVGTGGQVSIYSPGHRSASASIDVRPYPGGGFLHVGAALCSGKAYEQLRTFYRRVLRSFGADESRVDYATMNALASASGSGGAASGASGAGGRRLEVDTRFAGTRVDSSVSGSILKIGLENFTPENLTRAYIEGIAEELHGFYEKMEPAAREPIAHLVGSGNGLRSNPVLREAFERRFGRRVELPLRLEEAAIGAALCAAVGAGRYNDYRSAGELIAYGDREEPGGRGASKTAGRQ